MMLATTVLLPLELLLNALLNKYLINSYCVTFISDKSLTFSLPIHFINLIPDEENFVQQILNVSEMGCSDYVVLMKEPDQFMKAFERVIHIGKVRRSDRKIVILPYDENLKGSMWSSQILSMRETSFVANVLIVAYSQIDSDCVLFDLITHSFIGIEEDIRKPFYLDRFNSCRNEFDNEVNLFPHDMTNLFGKTLKVACFTYKPYVLLDLDTTFVPLGRDGIDIRVVEEFCRWINCTIEIVREDADLWGDIFENETGGIGILGSVVEDRADLGITALYPWYEEWRVMDFSVAGVRTGVTCIAPAPRLLSSWEMPLMPFTRYMWLAVIITFVYSSVGLFIAEKFSTNSNVFLSVFAMMIAQSQSESTVSWRIRSVTGWLLIVGLLLGSAYGAGLASTFTVPRFEPSVDTMQDIVDRNMIWGATHDAWTFSLISSTDPVIKQLVKQFQTYSFDELKRKSFTRSMAFSLEKLPAGTFAIGEYITKEAVLDMMLMLEDFYFEQCVHMMRKSSPYTEKVNQLVGRLHQSGLLLAWETQVALKHMDYKVQLEIRLSRSINDGGVTKALNVKNVEGVFIMFFTGIIVSVAVFLGELVHSRKGDHP